MWGVILERKIMGSLIIKFLAAYSRTRKQWDTAGSAWPVQDAADSYKSIVKKTDFCPDNKGEKDNQHRWFSYF